MFCSGNVGPLAIGLALVATAEAIGGYTGAALNSARVFGPAVVYGCNWGTFWIYLLAHLAASTVAAVWALTTNRPGPFFLGGTRDIATLLSHCHFTRAVPWSTAADPLGKVDALNSKDPSLAPYAKGLQLRKQALRELEGLIEKPERRDQPIHFALH